jgi:phosphate transport system substrate-binding protein
VAALLLPLVLAGCAESLPESQGLTGTVVVDGSSTVTPLLRAGAEEFVDEVEPGVTVALTTSGTTEGLVRLCDAGADVAMASREMTADERAACDEAGVDPVAVPVGADAITVVVPRRNDYVRCLTLDEVATVLGAEDPATTWADVRDGWPATTLVPFAPGPASGTADVFSEVVLDDGPLRADTATSEDDQVIVQGVATSPGGVGFVPLTYSLDAEDLVRPVAVDAGDGCVEPSADTAADGTYTPLARPLLVYVAAAAYQERPTVAAFVDYLASRADELADQVGGVPPATEDQQAAIELLDGLGAGSG